MRLLWDEPLRIDRCQNASEELEQFLRLPFRRDIPDEILKEFEYTRTKHGIILPWPIEIVEPPPPRGWFMQEVPGIVVMDGRAALDFVAHEEIGVGFGNLAPIRRLTIGHEQGREVDVLIYPSVGVYNPAGADRIRLPEDPCQTTSPTED